MGVVEVKDVRVPFKQLEARLIILPGTVAPRGTNLKVVLNVIWITKYVII